MNAKPIIKAKIIDIIYQDLKTSIPGLNTKIYSDEEIQIYIKKNTTVINHCIIEYIEDFGNDIDYTKNIDEDWISEYLGEYCVN